MAAEGPGQLPDDLREAAALALNKIGAYIGSAGDPAVMASFKEPPGLTSLFYLSAALFLVLYIVAEIGNYYEITNNWSHYQCMPSIAPFSKFYGHDLKETMNFCVGQQVKEHAGGVIAPIYKGINEVQGVVDGVLQKVEAVEGGIMGLLKGFQDFVVNFVNSFRLLGTRVRMSFIRIKEIFQRVYGIFIAFAYAAISAITFGENLICNPLVTFVAGFAGVDICCFGRETRVHMADGSTQCIAAVRIGDRLANKATVTATFDFDGRTVEMISIQGVHVSSNHSLLIDGMWIPAGLAPSAVPVPSRDRIYCLSTSTNMIPVQPIVGDGDLVFTDYEESVDPVTVREAQAAAEIALCGRAGNPVNDYGLGLDPQLFVNSEGKWCKLMDLRVGDTVDRGQVTGIVRELCQDVRITPDGVMIAAAQLVRVKGQWTRAGRVFATRTDPTILCQIFLSTNDAFLIRSRAEIWMVRDYQEWQGAETQEPYDRWLEQ